MRARHRSAAPRSATLTQLPDDALGTIAVSVAVAELQWTPDLAPAVLDRISRDAVTYPEHFDRRRPPPPVPFMSPAQPRSASRTLGRLAVFAFIACVMAALVLLAATANAWAAEADLEDLTIDLVPLTEGLDAPLFVTGAYDGSGARYVVEQTGRIMVIDADGEISVEPFLDLSSTIVAGGERGLLGMAPHPDFARNGRFYVNYTRAPDGATVVSEFSARDGRADPASERALLVIDQPFGNHNGGMLAFDASGMLLVGTGDGGGAGDPLGSGQDPASLLGKILRLDVDAGEPYAIPPDNGFRERDAYRPEIHVMGLRNPWRFSVDPDGGHVYVGDVGQDRWEEISLLPSGTGGGNLGWDAMEGPVCFRDGCDADAYTLPVLSYDHDEGCSVVGGYVYRGSAQPELEGIYLFGDYCSGTIWAASAQDMLAGRARAVPIFAFDGRLVSFGEDAAGELYAVDQGGRVFHIVAAEVA